MHNQPQRLAVSLTHSDLALLYFTDCDKVSASRRLTTWLKNDPLLMAELNATSYKSGQRYFTPKQLTIIFAHLGLPSPPDIQN